MDPDVYYTLGNRASAVIKVKGSRFIGCAAPVREVKEAQSFIQEILKRYHDATHNCFAYRIGIGDGSLFRYSDAGEPSGTAGKPILDAIDGRGVTDAICVVTRYFGGTKLGMGGLARAYARCAGETLEKCGKVERYLYVALRIVFGYDLTGTVMALISRYGNKVIDTIYGSETEMVLQVRESMEDKFKQDLMNVTVGKVRVSREGVRDY